MSDKPTWMNDEDYRAELQSKKTHLTNARAPKLVRVMRAPERKQKAFYIQPHIAEAFDLLALKQKKRVGRKSTDLAEEMILDLLNKYGEDVGDSSQ